MPPKRGKGIVKSGNAGNSTKASKSAPVPIPGSVDEKRPLFPAGFKYPLTILNERCHINGWEKTDVQTYQHSDGWSFAVTLSRINKKTSEKESVRMEPRPAYTRPSAIEARHWGATYALYRFCNHMKLHLVLPPGPRDYWNELEVEHKSAAPQLQWLYATDPFAAKKEFEDREAQLSQPNKSASRSGRQRGEASGGYKDLPEVKMASTIRELVEEAIKKGLSIYPEAAENDAYQLTDETTKNVSRQLEHLNFAPAQIQSAIKFLSESSATAVNLLATLSPLEAAIEYLVLYVPECDLPQRFLPSKNSSNPFVTSLHSGSDDIKIRWIEEKATKEAGWPENIVKECMADTRLTTNWDSLLVALGRRLIGENNEEISDISTINSQPYNIDSVELEAYSATFVTESELIMPLFSAPVKVHIFISTDSATAYPRPGFIPLYLSSESVPAYVRLHLLSRFLIGTTSDCFLESGEGFCLAAMRLLEEEWENLENNGRPDISSVLQHLLPRNESRPSSSVDVPEAANVQELSSGNRRQRSKLADKRSNIEIREEFITLRRKVEYLSLSSARQRLPAYKAKDAFLQTLQSHRVVVVVGETGCGKTTQIPQFILDSLILSDKGLDVSILVTQPRILAAISVANRVSAERLNDGSVGYAVRGDTKTSDKTKLLFCTTGVALRRMTSDQLQGVSHVIVDEVHERGIDSDILLLGLKQVLEKNDNVRVVLMSATINHEKFAEYFGGAPVLTIPGFSHPVTDFYLEDIESTIRDHAGPMKGNRATQGKEDSSNNGAPRRRGRNQVDYQLIAAVVSYTMTSAEKRGGILIFLSGIQEIRQCINTIRDVIDNKEADILPLHANLSNEEQSRVFKQTSKWKIIAATNVAETSITVDDVIYVIDTGKVKEMRYDPELHLSKLEECWISRAAGRQRRGRAGRTQPGTCYKLYTRQEEGDMEPFSVPEIHRIPLENAVLYVRTMYEGEDAKTLLGRAIDPPQNAHFDLAWNTLVDLGAVEPSGRTTPLGRYMAGLPADVKLAKMLILGTIFQCLDPILTIVACLSSKPLFVSPMDKRDEATSARARFSTAGSDLLTNLRAYEECMRLRAQGDNTRAISRFCEENFISPSSVQSVTSLRNSFFSNLTELGLIPAHLNPSSKVLNYNSDLMNLVKSIVLGGLWPHVARVRVRQGAQKFDQIQAGTIAREIKARDYTLYDPKDGRVFLHPGSVLFDCTSWKCDFVTYFHKYQSDKVYLRDATQVPLYSLLLLGGSVTVNHVMGGLDVVSSNGKIKLKAWPRIGILVNQLRRLLDAQLAKCFENGAVLSNMPNREVIEAFQALIINDGMSDGN
ncbi:P-loop containing nucleoside triphosphate hydrolase protein [Amanita muscaria]